MVIGVMVIGVRVMVIGVRVTALARRNVLSVT